MDLAESKALVRRYYDEVLTGSDRELLARLLGVLRQIGVLS